MKMRRASMRRALARLVLGWAVFLVLAIVAFAATDMQERAVAVVCATLFGVGIIYETQRFPAA